MNALAMIKRSARHQTEDARFPTTRDLAPVQDVPHERTQPDSQDYLPDPPVEDTA